jgi:hypothetical protein
MIGVLSTLDVNIPLLIVTIAMPARMTPVMQALGVHMLLLIAVTVMNVPQIIVSPISDALRP